MSTPEPPAWPHCADSAADLVGCRGIHVPGRTAHLAHLADVDRDAHLASLTPGSDIDHRRTPFTEPLLNALRDIATQHPRLGTRVSWVVCWRSWWIRTA
ncbi:hypothetical protein [Streptomyces sp. NPDC057052]|uniref:hypothetical protein n=1 Tax=Streptomyces sp. NPDC057052 TaxID=3346010 RepID=UPI003643C93F